MKALLFYLGLDLGQATDFSAACILEPHGPRGAEIYDVRYLHRFPLGTSYPAIVREVQALLARPPLLDAGQLVIDHTGVGRPVFDLFAEGGTPAIGVTITGGATWRLAAASQYHVAKTLLVSVVQKLLQSGRLRVTASLQHAPTLQKELRDFRVKISKSETELYDAREGQHDDLLLSLAVALWLAEHVKPLETPGPIWFLRGSSSWAMDALDHEDDW